jgi:hypothetical protein
MAENGVGTPLETTALLVQHSLFSFTYHADFETRYLIG